MEVQHTMEPLHDMSMFTVVGSAWESCLPTLILNNILNPALSGFMTLVSTVGYLVLNSSLEISLIETSAGLGLHMSV